MADEKGRHHVMILLEPELYEELQDFRWDNRERSFRGMCGRLLADGLKAHKQQRQQQLEQQAEMAS